MASSWLRPVPRAVTTRTSQSPHTWLRKSMYPAGRPSWGTYAVLRSFISVVFGKSGDIFKGVVNSITAAHLLLSPRSPYISEELQHIRKTTQWALESQLDAIDALQIAMHGVVWTLAQHTFDLGGVALKRMSSSP